MCGNVSSYANDERRHIDGHKLIETQCQLSSVRGKVSGASRRHTALCMFGGGRVVRGREALVEQSVSVRTLQARRPLATLWSHGDSFTRVIRSSLSTGTVREYYHPEIKVEKTVTFSSVRIQFTNTF